MDSQFIWNALLTIGMAVIGALVALGANYLAQIQEALKERMDAQDDKIQQVREDYKKDFYNVACKTEMVQDDLGKFKVAVQREFVNRDEYIRTTQSLDSKIDRVLGEITKIQVNVARIAGAKEGNGK